MRDFPHNGLQLRILPLNFLLLHLYLCFYIEPLKCTVINPIHLTIVVSLSRKRAILIDIFKNLMHQSPAFMWNCYKPKHINYNLRNTNTLCIPHSKTTRYGLQTLTAYGAKLWNSLPNNIKSCTDLNHFKSAIETWQEPRCKCRMCRP